MRIKKILYILVIAGIFVGVSQSYAGSDVIKVTKEELKPLLDNPDVIVLDVRRGKDWKSSEFKIKGATYEDPGNFDSWVGKYGKDKKIVLYCA